MKKVVSLMLCLVIMEAFMLFAMGSTEEGTESQDVGTVQPEESNNKTLGDYAVEIKSCRLAKDYDKKPVVIVTYAFTNNGDEAVSFDVALETAVFQDDVGLNQAYILADEANYSEDNQNKKVKKGATLDVEVAYELNDTTTDLEVEVSEWISFSDKTVTKTFKLK